MKNLIKSLAMFTLLASIVSCATKKTEWSVKSPSQNIQFNVKLGENNQLTYNVSVIESGAEKVIANYIKAIGGKEMLDKIQYNTEC